MGKIAHKVRKMQIKVEKRDWKNGRIHKNCAALKPSHGKPLQRENILRNTAKKKQTKNVAKL